LNIPQKTSAAFGADDAIPLQANRCVLLSA